MSIVTITLILIAVLFVLLGSGLWVGLSLVGSAWIASEFLTTKNLQTGANMVSEIWASSSSWTLTALPMFIWMGEILYRTRSIRGTCSRVCLRGWRRCPGGWCIRISSGCTVFAAVSGSSAATLTTVGKMSIPELRKRNYPERMIIGTLARVRPRWD